MVMENQEKHINLSAIRTFIISFYNELQLVVQHFLEHQVIIFRIMKSKTTKILITATYCAEN